MSRLPQTTLAGIRRQGGAGGGEGRREGGREAAAEDRRVGEPVLDGHGGGEGHGGDNGNHAASAFYLQQAEVQLQAG